MRTTAAIVLLSSLFVAACADQDDDATTPTSPTSSGAVAFQRVTIGSFSRVSEASTRIALNEADYADLLALVVPAEPIRSPNFNREMAVGVFLGWRPSAGFRFRVTSVTKTGDVLEIQALETTPPSQCVVAQVLTQPFEIVALPRTGSRVRVTVTREVGQICP